MSIYKREIDTQCCNAWMQGIRTINGQYPNDNRDLTLTAGSGIAITPETAGLRITNISAGAAIAGDNIEITPSGDDQIIGLVSDPVINGDLQVNGDIIQNGSAYETHAEKVYTTNDYIITRDGAVSALSPGDYSGFQVKKYDGTNDGRLVIDNAGVARVGDVGDEQPLLTRDESTDLTNDHLMKWDATNQKAIDSGISTNDIDDALDTKVSKSQYNTDMAGKVSGSGNIGSDTKPVKVVGGVATAVTDDLAKLSQVSVLGDFFHVGMTTTQTVNVGANWTAVNLYSTIASKGSSISFSGGNTFTINADGTYLIQITNRHDSGAFGGTGIEYPSGFTECTGEDANEVRNQFTIIQLSNGNTVTIKQYGDQGSMPGYGNLNHCSIIRLN